jgi:hypothetical protein
MTINHTSKAAGTFSKLSELNKATGKKLDPQEEYIFELIEAKDQPMKAWQSTEDKAAGKPAAKKVHAATTWREITTGIEVFQKFNIESVSRGNSPTDSKRSKVLKFLDDIGLSIPTSKPIEEIIWDQYFIPTMKIRARVVPSTNPDEYYFKEGSFRKYQV